MSAAARRAAVTAALTLTSVLVAGCGGALYLSESEVAAYRAVVGAEQNANDFLRDLDGQRVRVDFVRDGQGLRIQRSNILDTFRGTRLVIVEQLFSQVHLDRLSTQIEQALQAWVADQVAFLEHANGSRVALNPLDHASLEFLGAPTVSYLPSRQVVAFNLRLRLTVSGTLEVHGLEGLLRTLFGWLITDERYAFSLTLDDYVLPGEITLADDPPGSRIRLSLAPQPGTVSVTGVPSGDIEDAIRALAREKFSRVVAERYRTVFDYFSLTGLSLSPTGEFSVVYHDAPERAMPTVHVVVQGDQAGQLYHGRLRRNVPTAFTPVPVATRILGPPALAASGADRLELGFVTTTGQFQYASWHDGRWDSQYTSAERIFNGWRPALVATAPGQLEVILWGQDRGLYHLRRWNGRWLAPARLDDSRIPNRPLFQPTAVQAGDKVVLVFVNNAGRVYGMVFDLETAVWSDPAELPGPGASLAPAVASCGDGRVDVVYGGPRPDVTVQHSVLLPTPAHVTATTRSGFTLITPARTIGGLGADPALACSGAYQLELVGRGQGNRLLHSHYQLDQGVWDGQPFQPGWQPFQQLTDQFFGSLFAAGVDYFTAVASTRSGDVSVVTRTTDGKRLVYNRYISSRWGQAPRKAVHWRGFEHFGPDEVFGPPAVAITDPQMHVATRGGNGQVWHTSIGNDNYARFTGVPSSFIAFPFEAVVTSSGPQRTEILFPDEAGRVNYVSWRNQAGYRSQVLPSPPATSIASPLAAVSIGTGQLEVVAIGLDHAMYHWRFINGQWSAPARVGGPVISAPVLVSTGAGQLELLAVDGNSLLHRWRFVGGGWLDYGPQGSYRVGGPSFDSKSVASAGDGTVDVAIIEVGTNDVYHIRLTAMDRPVTPAMAGLNRWTLAGWDANDIALTVLSPGEARLIVQRRSDRQVFSRAVGSTGPWTTVIDPFARRLLLGGAITLGDGQVVLLAANLEDGQLYLARQRGGEATTFLPLIGQSAESRFALPTKPALTVE